MKHKCCTLSCLRLYLCERLKVFLDIADQFFFHREHHDMIVFFKYGVMMYRNDLAVANQSAHHNAGWKIDRVHTAANNGIITIIDDGQWPRWLRQYLRKGKSLALHHRDAHVLEYCPAFPD